GQKVFGITGMHDSIENTKSKVSLFDSISLLIIGLFQDLRDIAFAFSTDGVQLFKIGKFDIWPLLLVNLNLPPSKRVKRENLMLCGIIPGRRNPKDINSFLRPLVDELKLLSNTGIPDVYDAASNSKFTLRA